MTYETKYDKMAAWKSIAVGDQIFCANHANSKDGTPILYAFYEIHPYYKQNGGIETQQPCATCGKLVPVVDGWTEADYKNWNEQIYAYMFGCCNAFIDFVGNKRAIRRLLKSVRASYNDRFRRCGQNFALVGPASTGKTTIAKKFAKMMLVPFAEISPRSINKLDDVLIYMAKACEDFWHELEIDPIDHTDILHTPPMVVFIDEVHALKNNIVQGLLKAVESNDAELITENGYVVNCQNVCWVIATTDRGKLFDAFDTRFTKVNLQSYTKDEIGEIVWWWARKQKMPDPECKLLGKLVSHYCSRVPREALAFADELLLERQMSPDSIWEDCARQVADDRDIDEWGMSHDRVKILTALGTRGPIGKGQMTVVAECKQEELEKFIMPPMLSSTVDQEALVQMTTRGYSITYAGLEQLNLRGIANLGPNAIPENIRSMIETSPLERN